MKVTCYSTDYITFALRRELKTFFNIGNDIIVSVVAL